MKLNARKAIMKAIRVAGLNDFKSDEEMLMAKALYSKMAENSNAPEKKKRAYKKKEVETPTA